MTELLSSGVVPRELIAGVVWDEAAEARFVEFAKGILSKANQKIEGWRESSLREAVWAVEADLHRKFIKARVIEADSCYRNDAKKALVSGWKKKYGAERTDRLVRMVRHAELKKTILKDW